MAETEAPAPPTIADPAPLGLGGFATTTLALSLVNAGLMPKTVEPVIIPIALFYGGLAQFMAGMWEFRKGNTFGATVFGSFGAFWLGLGVFLLAIAESIPKADQATATGLYLLVFGVMVLIVLIASLKTNPLFVTIVVVLLLTFIALIAAEFGAVSLAPIGGYLGILTAILAYYGSLAGIANATFGRQVFPTGAK